MDFSLKQVFGVVIVIAIAGLVLAVAIKMTNDNNATAKAKNTQLWKKANDNITSNDTANNGTGEDLTKGS